MTNNNPKRTVLGIENLLSEKSKSLEGERIGLICNQSSVNHEFVHTADLFFSNPKTNLTALFGPQHGIRGDVQDNMVETPHSTDKKTKLPIFSLYSETREPTEEMLGTIDTFVFDMQDIGCRIYTFAYTLANCMIAAKKFGKKVIVCDRPNPINGTSVEGTVLDPQYTSFVGQYALATRHGMTIGELAKMFNDHWEIECELELVLMDEWRREQWFDQTGAPWVLPSPNIPTPDTTVVFPGTVHVEGTELSEGRGTTRPFDFIGAPFIDSDEYAENLRKLGLSGVIFRAANFQPTFQKHARATCGGVQIHVTNREVFEPVITGVAAVKLAYDMYPADFSWKRDAYEYEFEKNPFDVISGTNKLREQIEQGASVNQIRDSWQENLAEFKRLREKFLLY